MTNILNSKFSKKLESYFFSFLLYELFLGGSGRICSFGPISLRMILFSIALVWFGFRIRQNPNKKFTLVMVSIFGLIISIGAYVGFLHNASKELIFTDIKQLLFFLSIICFSFCINTQEQIHNVVKILKNATLILAIAYLLCYILIQLNIIQMQPFYNMLSVEWLHDEFMFRGNGGNFFYKGFFYFGIGIFFYLFNKPSIKNGVIALLIYIALFLTLLRWLLAITIVIYAFAIFFCWTFNKFKLSYLKSKEMIFHFLLLVIMTSIPLVFKNFYITTLGSKQESVDIRKEQFNQVKSQIFSSNKIDYTLKKDKNTTKADNFNFILGKGLGNGVPIRPIHMELTYLEIFFKQGILGLSFWLFILVYCLYNFKKLLINHTKINLLIPWISGVLIIYLQSITNPLLVNSIGMSFVIIAMLILRNKNVYTNKI